MKLKSWCALALISLAPCFTTGARAMSIHDFGKMNDDDEATFVAFLVENAAHMFKVQGQPDLARKVIEFFKTPGKDGGTYQFADQLKQAYAVNVKNATNPNNRAPDRLVEDAMAATLRAHDLPVPAGYLITIGKDFHPVGPPRANVMGPSQFQ